MCLSSGCLDAGSGSSSGGEEQNRLPSSPRHLCFKQERIQGEPALHAAPAGRAAGAAPCGGAAPTGAAAWAALPRGSVCGRAGARSLRALPAAPGTAASQRAPPRLAGSCAGPQLCSWAGKSRGGRTALFQAS